MSLLTLNKLTSSVGAEVVGVEADRLTSDDVLAQAVLEALED
ncbi:MAG TPA: TauD/TfdA family dioxygenase, partial [Mycobacterium sp.]|nr:TauD/TfdA family dioxygenase [Mycobacterium sp.]